jgi:hypothetical protein
MRGARRPRNEFRPGIRGTPKTGLLKFTMVEDTDKLTESLPIQRVHNSRVGILCRPFATLRACTYQKTQ